MQVPSHYSAARKGSKANSFSPGFSTAFLGVLDFGADITNIKQRRFCWLKFCGVRQQPLQQQNCKRTKSTHRKQRSVHVKTCFAFAF